ncbi:hypothetical protein AB4Z52_30840 [Rhizobium sp. 2YAF20]|uniref:hypothetical protein n=1 Tax=Rhizobium sp. 2YAF20 TaxID=3233027 RepID=UPI003F955B0E
MTTELNTASKQHMSNTTGILSGADDRVLEAHTYSGPVTYELDDDLIFDTALSTMQVSVSAGP